MSIELGDSAKDIITGYEGIVMEKIDYFTGCDHVRLLDPDKRDENGAPVKGTYFDITRVKLLEKCMFNFGATYLQGGPVPGDEVKDVITGYEGIVMGRAKDLSGYDSVGVQSMSNKDKNGEPADWVWLASARMKVIEVGAVKLEAPAKEEGATPTPGGPQQHAPSR